MVDEQASREKRRGSSFYFPMLALPVPQRNAMLALYDLCRAVDDAVDEATDSRDSRQKLASWRREIDRMYKGSAAHPLAVALYPSLIEYGLKKHYFDEMMDGFSMDAEGETFAPQLSKLYLYCYRVAGTVGLLSMQIFGCGGEDAENFAKEMGYALQLTNIIRDIVTDYERGRIYLPREYFGDIGLLPDEFTLSCDRIPEMREELGEIAFKHFNACEALLPRLEAGKLKAALMMKHVYHQQLEEMKAARWQLYTTKSHSTLGKLKKARMLAGGMKYLFS